MLADRPEFISELARLYVCEWEPYYGPSGPGDAVRDLSGCINRDCVPLVLIALDADETVLGTAALKESSIAEHGEYGPWLAALVVRPEMRGAGIAIRLVRAIEVEACRLGYASLYTATNFNESKILDGWIKLEDGVATLREPVAIYSKSLVSG